MPERTAAEAAQEQIQSYRDAVGGVVGFVRSQEITRAYSSLSLEELIDRRIERIEAPQSGGKPGALARLNALKTEFENAIEGIRNTSPDAFRAPNPSADANTPDTSGST